MLWSASPMAARFAPVREFMKIRQVDYVDLPTGHRPQFTRPDDLGRVIVHATESGRDQSV
jgi:hypothetical protein